MTNTPPQGESDSWTDHLVAVGVSALVGVAIGILIGAIVQGSGDDEAPIRVRNGSVYLEILSASAKWVQDGNEWKLDRGTRRKDELDILVVPTFPQDCGVQTPITRERVYLEYDNDKNKTVEIRGTGRHLRVRPDGITLTLTNNDQTLSYTPASGYLSAVYDDKNKPAVCTFAPGRPLLGMGVFDFPK